MKTELRENNDGVGEYLLVAETDEENNVIAAVQDLLLNAIHLKESQNDKFGCCFNDGKPRNYVYITVRKPEENDNNTFCPNCGKKFDMDNGIKSDGDELVCSNFCAEEYIT